MKIFFSVVLTIAGLIILGLIYIYSGFYNVSAMEHENGITRWVLNTTRENSIDPRLKEIAAPNLEDQKMINRGLSHYKEMCADCHGAPGREKSELAQGLNPDPPDLVKSGYLMQPAEIFWITKNGIRMTGMPAWGKTHSDDKIWDIVAAVKKLNQTTKKKYDAIRKEMDED